MESGLCFAWFNTDGLNVESSGVGYYFVEALRFLFLTGWATAHDQIITLSEIIK
jgi:hypothetical protein